jgi:peptidyl-prolyl cis-trans isomerase SurA
MKKLLWVIPTILLGFCGAEAKTVDRILAQVNDEIITMAEVNRLMQEQGIREQLAAKYSGDALEPEIQKAQKQILDSLIEDKLLYQKAMDMGFSSDIDKDVSSAIQHRMKELNIKDTDELEKTLEQQGSTLAELRENYRRSIIINALVDTFVRSRITLLTPEIERYYQDHLAEFSSPAEVTLSDIEISVGGDEKAAEDRANDLYRRLQQGESFPTLANQYSNGTTASKGGGIGTYLISTLNANTAKAIANLKEGEVSKPQREKDHYVIYHVDSRKPSVVQPLEDVKDNIRARLFEQKFTPELERYVSRLKEDAYIQYFSEIKQ